MFIFHKGFPPNLNLGLLNVFSLVTGLTKRGIAALILFIIGFTLLWIVISLNNMNCHPDVQGEFHRNGMIQNMRLKGLDIRFLGTVIKTFHKQQWHTMWLFTPILCLEILRKLFRTRIRRKQWKKKSRPLTKIKLGTNVNCLKGRKQWDVDECTPLNTEQMELLSDIRLVL